MSAFASYRRGKYDDTDLHRQPLPDALSRQPGCGLRPIPDRLVLLPADPRRDPRSGRDTRKAIAAFEDIVTHYPDSEYAADAQQKLIVARDQLAGKEMQIGRYYLEQRQYLAAINRFRTVVTDYQSTRHVEEALERLTEAYFSLGLTSEAQTAAAVLGHNFPDSPWYDDAYKLLQTGGLEPNENKGSWISKVFSGHKTG